MNLAKIDKILKLSKFNNTIDAICKEVKEPYKDVVEVLINNNNNKMLGFKQSITKDLKIIENHKSIEERTQLVNNINQSINTMCENFKWLIDNLNQNCWDYYNENILRKSINNPTEEEITNLIKSIKNNDSLAIIELDLQFTPNQIIQYAIHINNIKKSIITNKLSKTETETKKDERKLIRLDIENIIEEMYLIYKWIAKTIDIVLK